MPSKEDVILVTALGSDAILLARIQGEAFDSESARCGRAGPGGPEGYDNEKGMLGLMTVSDVLRIDHHGRTVGGVAVTNSETRCRLVRIFVDPGNQGRGIGHLAFDRLLERYRDAAVWELDTPSWSSRNHRFYESLGFVKVGETDEGERGFRLYLYERAI